MLRSIFMVIGHAKAEYRPCSLSTFISYGCLPLQLWFAFIVSRYKIVFNISERLLFITKEVIRSFPIQLSLRVCQISDRIKNYAPVKENPEPLPPPAPRPPNPITQGYVGLKWGFYRHIDSSLSPQRVCRGFARGTWHVVVSKLFVFAVNSKRHFSISVWFI